MTTRKKAIAPKEFTELTAEQLQFILLNSWKKDKKNLKEWESFSLEKRRLFETVLSNIAAYTLTSWERKLRTFNMPATIISEPTFMRASLTNPEYGAQDIFYPPDYTEILTGHPTSSFDLEPIKVMHELQSRLEGKGKKEILEFISSKGANDDTVSDMVGTIGFLLNPAKKLSTMDETKRASYFGKQRYDAIPKVMLRVDQVSRAYSDGTETLVTVDELNRLPAPRLKSWQGDRDSKPNITAKVIEEAVAYNMAETRRWHNESVLNLAAQLRKNISSQNQQAVNLIALQIGDGGKIDANELREKFPDQKMRQEIFEAGVKAYIAKRLEQMLPYADAEALRTNLAKLKEDLQEKGYEKYIPKLQEDGVDTRYTLLDTVYKQVQTAADCYPVIELRQNARMHQKTMEHVRKLMKTPDKDGRRLATSDELADRPNLTPLIHEARRNTQFGRVMREKVEAYKPEVEAYYALKEKWEVYNKLDPKQIPPELDKEMMRLEKDKEFQERLAFYETLRAFELVAKYPSAIQSYVIAETGVVPAEKKNDKGKMRDKAAAQAREDTLTPLLFLELMADDASRKKNGGLPNLEIIPLLETRDSIISADQMLINLFYNPIFEPDVLRNTADKIPEIYDSKKKSYRKMTVADAKILAGIVPYPEDEDRELRGKLTIMFAGSDSMRENGPCIGPLNAHNQEKIFLQALEQGYLVEIYQGVGGAIHRSTPASFHVARQTTQGAVNEISTPETIANRTESHIAAAMMDRRNFALDPVEHKRHYATAALYPGHLGNAMMLQPENDTIRKETFKPLLAGCKAHAAMFEDGAYDTFIEKASGLNYTKWCNYSARPDQRQDRAFSAASLRAIGYNLAHFSMGTNTTLWKGMSEFMDIDKETGSFDFERTKHFIENSSKIQDMMTRTVFGLAIADYDMAWKFQGITRSINREGEIILEKNGQKVKLDKLISGAVSERTKQFFGDEAVVLAKLDKEYHMVAKAVHETYFHMQHPERVLPKKFEPKMLFDIMPPEMRREIKEFKEVITPARETLATHKNDKSKVTDADMRYAYATLTQMLETGAPQCLAQISHTYNNDFVRSGNVRQAMKTDPYSVKIHSR